MAGTLTISTLSDGTNSTSATNLTKAPCVAWVAFSVSSGTVTLRGNYNVSSVTRSAQGQYSLSFANALTDANYSALLSNSTQLGSSATNNQIFCTGANGNTASAPTSSGFSFVFNVAYTGGMWDPNYATIAVFR